MIPLTLIKGIVWVMVLVLIFSSIIRQEKVIPIEAIDLTIDVKGSYCKKLRVFTAQQVKVSYLPEESNNLIRLKLLISLSISLYKL